MVEIFRTNVPGKQKARLLLKVLRETFSRYEANFDLEDEDRILRIESSSAISPDEIIDLLNCYSCKAVLIEDQVLMPKAG